MKKYLIIFLLIILKTPSYAQDPSFSQFDLNMMYMNPAWVGYEKEFKVLLHRRNQWVGIPEKFNTNILEISPIYLHNKRSLGAHSALALGFYIIEDHENTVFKNSAFGASISYITKLSTEHYINFAIQPSFHMERLSWDALVFSDQFDNYGNFSNSNAIAPSGTNNNTFDIGSGILWTYNMEKKKMIFNLGIAGYHLSTPISSFYKNQNEDAKYPVKLTVHSQLTTTMPENIFGPIRYTKLFFRNQRHLKLLQKNEIGASFTYAKRIFQLDMGGIYRLAKTYNGEYMGESLIPIIRARFPVNLFSSLEMSYSYDYNISRLRNVNSFMVNEISISLYLMRNKKGVVCPAEGMWGNENIKWDSELSY